MSLYLLNERLVHAGILQKHNNTNSSVEEEMDPNNIPKKIVTIITQKICPSKIKSQ